MTLVAVVVTVIVPAAAGIWAVRGRWEARLPIGALFGISVTVLATAAAVVVGQLLLGTVVGLAALGWVGWKRPIDVNPIGARPARPSLTLTVLLGAGLILLACALIRPVPEWDAFAIWSLKAKFLASNPSYHSPAFRSPQFFWDNPLYPPFLPVWQATALRISGVGGATWPLQVQLSVLWTAAAAALYTMVAPRGPGALAPVAAWLLAPAVGIAVMTGYADVPMALLLLCGTVALDRLDRRAAQVVGGALFAAAAMTKSEGALFTFAVLGCWGLLALRRRDRTWREIAAQVAPAVGCYVAWAVIVSTNHVKDQVLNGDAVHNLLHLPAQLHRLGPIARHLVGEWRGWRVLLVALVALAVVRRPHLPTLLAAGATLAVVVGLYLVTPLDLEFHLSSSIGRTIVAPIGLLAASFALSDRRAEKETPPATVEAAASD